MCSNKFFDIRGYFNISEFETSKADCNRILCTYFKQQLPGHSEVILLIKHISLVVALRIFAVRGTSGSVKNLAM